MAAKSKLSLLVVLVLVMSSVFAFGSAYNAKPKLVVIVIVDQLRGDMLERFHDELTPQGFRLLLDRGAWYKNCYYQYANTETAPGHATLGTGTYTLGHGIIGNEWYDSARGRMVTSVEDEKVKVLGAVVEGASASPRNLLSDTLVDELKLATGGKAKAFTVALKDRAAVLTGGFSANAAFWIDRKSGAWITSSYYMDQAPGWVMDFNKAGNSKYLNREWKDATGKVLRTTLPAQDAKGKQLDYYDLVGPTPFANDYTIEFARTLIENEHMGEGPVTDLLVVSFSSHDVLGHKVGPDSPEEKEMILSLDRQLAGFFDYLQKRVGIGSLVLALSADHGVAPMPEYANQLRIPATRVTGGNFGPELNRMLSAKLGREAQYVMAFDYPKAFLNPEAFAAVHMTEADAERTVGDAMVQLGIPGYVTRTQLAANDVPNTVFTNKLRNSYSPIAGWYVAGFVRPFTMSSAAGTSHGLPYSYDSHVPLAFYGPAFKPGVYRQEAEPTDLVVTLSSVLGINKPTSATGQVRWESISATVAH